jgi:hypothetical protein
MTAFARHIADVLYLKRFHRTADIRFGCGLYGIPYSYVGNCNVGMIRLHVGLVDDWHHARDVNLIANKFIEVEWLITGVPEVQREWLTAPESAAQSKTEEAGRIGLRTAHCRTIRAGNFNVRKRQLLLGIGVLAQDRSLYCDRLGFVNGNEHCGESACESSNRKSPNHDLSSASHAVSVDQYSMTLS